MDFELRASDLQSKWGFSDGGILDDVLDEAGLLDLNCEYDADEHLSYAHEVLATCVERHLLPLLPGVQTFRIGTSHNPIRTDMVLVGAQSDVAARLSASTVLAVAREVAVARKARQQTSQGGDL